MITTTIYHHCNCHCYCGHQHNGCHTCGSRCVEEERQHATTDAPDFFLLFLHQSIKSTTKRKERKERIREEEASCTGILLVSKKKKRKKRKKSITRYTQEPCKTKAKVKRARAYHQKHRDSKGRVSRNLKRRSGRKEGFWKRTVRNYHNTQKPCDEWMRPVHLGSKKWRWLNAAKVRTWLSFCFHNRATQKALPFLFAFRPLAEY